MLTDVVRHAAFEWVQYEFMQRALVGIVILAPLYAVLGCVIINKQMAFFADTMGHSALTGIALGVLAGLQEPFWAMVACAVVLSVLIAWLRHLQVAAGDTLLGLVMSFTVALGIVLLSRGGSFHRYARYLVGDILTIGPGDLVRVGVFAAGVLGMLAWNYNKIVLLTVHRPVAASRGVGVLGMDMLLSVLIAISVMVSIAWVGILVINSLLLLPAAAARNVTRSGVAYVWSAVGFSLLSGVGGVIASYYLSSAAGATIVLCAMGIFLLSLLVRR